MGIEAAILGGIGGLIAGSLYTANEARQDQKRATRATRRIEDRKAQRSKQEQLRQAQLQAASIEASSGAQGTLAASASEGGVASVYTQAASNVSFIEQVNSAQKQISKHLESAQKNQFLSSSLASAASVASAFASPTPTPKTPSAGQAAGSAAQVTTFGGGG